MAVKVIEGVSDAVINIPFAGPPSWAGTNGQAVIDAKGITWVYSTTTSAWSQSVAPSNIFSGTATSAASPGLNNAVLPQAVIDAAGAYTVPFQIQSNSQFMGVPSVVPLPNGNFACFFQYVPNGALGVGSGIVQHVILDPQGNALGAPVTDIADISNGLTPLSIQNVYPTILSDGRLLLMMGFVPPVANPVGMNGFNGFVNPDGQPGNIRFSLATISGNTITWASDTFGHPVQTTLVTGFSTSGFDYTGIQPAWEPVTGQLVFNINGSNNSFFNNQIAWLSTVPGTPTTAGTYLIGYVVGSFSPNGPVTFSTMTSGQQFSLPSGAQALNENALAPVFKQGVFQNSFVVLYRNNAAAGASPQIQVTGTGTIAQLIAGTVSWGAAAVPVTELGSSIAAYADMCMTWDPQSGVIMFLSRILAGSFPPPPALGASGFYSTNNGGQSWSQQVADTNPPTVSSDFITNWWYASIVIVPGSNVFLAVSAVQMASAVGGSIYQLRARFGAIGASVLPNGGFAASSIAAGYGVFSEGAQIGPYQIPAAQSEALLSSDYTLKPMGLNPFVSVIAMGTTFGGSGPPGYVDIAPPRHLAQLPQALPATGIYWANADAVGLADSSAIPWTLGVLYLFRLSAPPQTGCKALYLEPGSVAGSGGCTVYASLYSIGSGALLSRLATNVGVLNPANTADVQFVLSSPVTPGVGTSGTDHAAVCLGLLHVGGTPPSWMGKTISAIAAARTPLPYATSGSGLTSLPVSVTGASMASGGAGVVPRVMCSVN